MTYANVVATLALFVSLGGVSYAVTALPADSVGQRQLSFPLGLTARSASNTTLPIWFCPPGAPCAAPIPKVIATTSITLKRSDKLLVLASGNRASVQVSNPQIAVVALPTLG